MLDVSATWWVDDRATRTRRLRSEKIGVYDRRAPAAVLAQQLAAGLETVDQWALSDLGPPRGPFPAAASAAPGVERAARLSLR